MGAVDKWIIPAGYVSKFNLCQLDLWVCKWVIPVPQGSHVGSYGPCGWPRLPRCPLQHAMWMRPLVARGGHNEGVKPYGRWVNLGGLGC